MVNVELVYIPAGSTPIHLYLIVSPGATVADVVEQSGLLTTRPEINNMAVGIFSKLVTLDTIVREGDRIEIYRPLLIDPKEKRRQRAKGK